ncbi:RHS repeat-associated core domain-containing protein [Streptomyces sp. NPDC049541]|uniref:RHS repeat-associated core domain-containing protein n=1 Tax=Streptomyces sp. NPDC049541 TaxID=3365594 RepID=UPI0037A4EFEC
MAVRTGSGSLQWQVTDGHDTAEAAVDSGSQGITRRRLDPFGNPRGTQPASGAWLGDKGFVNGIQNATSGLTLLGAREYDPTIGRFVSDDPILELTDAQQIDGYTYAGNNPLTHSDPSGLMFPGDGPNCYSDGCGVEPAPTPVTKKDISNGGDSGGGGSSHHGCGWSFSCHLSSLAHKAYHAVQQHPVIAAVVATAVVVGVVACVAATAGGCGAVLVAGAEGFTAGAEAGSLGAAAVGASVGVASEGGAVIAGSMGIAGAGAAAVAEGSKTASAEDAAASTGAKSADAAAEHTASSGSAKAAERAATRAQEIQDKHLNRAPKQPDTIAHKQRMVAVVETDGPSVVGGGARDLNPDQQAMIDSGTEMAAKMPRAHGEETAVTGAVNHGLIPHSIGTSMDFCDLCELFIQETGGIITGPRTAVWPQFGGPEIDPGLVGWDDPATEN